MRPEGVVAGLILAPGSPQNLRLSVRLRVPFAALTGHLSEEGIRALRESVGASEGFRCWAVGAHNRALWESLSSRSLILFIEGGSGHFTDEAVAVGRIRSATFGPAIWGEPWEHPFVIGGWRRRRIPKQKLFKELGYSEEYRVPGIVKVVDERCRAAIRKWGNLRRMLDALDASV